MCYSCQTQDINYARCAKKPKLDTLRATALVMSTRAKSHGLGDMLLDRIELVSLEDDEVQALIDELRGKLGSLWVDMALPKAQHWVKTATEHPTKIQGALAAWTQLKKEHQDHVHWDMVGQVASDAKPWLYADYPEAEKEINYFQKQALYPKPPTTTIVNGLQIDWSKAPLKLALKYAQALNSGSPDEIWEAESAAWSWYQAQKYLEGKKKPLSYLKGDEIDFNSYDDPF